MDFEFAKAAVELNQQMKESEEEMKLNMRININATNGSTTLYGCGTERTPATVAPSTTITPDLVRRL